MDESRAWPRYELLDDELLVTPAPSSLHQLVVVELLFALEEYLRREAVGILFSSPADLELREGTITQPDVFVVPADVQPAKDVLQWSDVRSLLLAVEVLSPSSADTDRVRKRDFYLESGVVEYWIVDADARVVEVWSATRRMRAIVRETLTWSPTGATSELTIDLAALFDRVARKLRAGA